ncbi:MULTISPECIES: carbohydrate porin [unclassified Pseudomonas]|uniref:carbohydrate porin n=1 Tax=unclassified Pseudomonas TaxID=196821 RepID=UPI0015A2D594|nr:MULTISPECIES: carbohydrate porin [unclassified Pseudomonas]NVZ17591.1 carbohydrate porin [Pseudomonas sp. IPO3775]NWA80397.1 carbohydrate porin [Pseudomonas sp. C8002]
MKKITVAGVGLLSACVFSSAHAQGYSPNNFLLGDWNGERTRLHDQGVDFQLTYVNELAYNTQGGEEHKGTYSDQLMADTQFDLQKLFGWKGASFRMTLSNRNGESLTSEAKTNTLLAAQEIYGYGSVTRLVQFYYQQALMDDRLVVKLGRLPMSGDVFPFSCKFQNLTFCGAVPGYITPNWFTWPVSQWGTAVSAKLTDELALNTSLYQVNPRFTENSQGLNFGSPSGTTGYLAVGELAWTPTLNGMPGTYRVGIWRNTGDFNDVYRDVNHQPIGLTGNAPEQHESASGYYAMAEQRVYQDLDNRARGVTVFANFIQSGRDVSYVEKVWHAGAFVSGPFAGRPQDELGLAIGRLEVNEKSAQRIRQQSGYTQTAPDTEYPMELYYGIAVTPALTLRPNVQYTSNPGGLSGDKSVVVFGLKTEVSF